MWSQLVCYDDYGDRFGRSDCRSAGGTRRHDGDAITMTDDTDHDEREDGEGAVSLPLIDTFAALEAELDAKTDRIERLESELDRGYLDPDGGEPDSVDASEASEGDDDTVPRSHEDWEPETDPLDDTGAATADGDHEGVTPTVDSPAEPEPSESETGSAASSQPERSSTDDSGGPQTVEESGLSPVRTASSGSESPESGEGEHGDGPGTDEEFGVAMEASENLTGGSLGSSTDGPKSSDRSGREHSDDSSGPAAADPLPDPTADRGERLSLLVRRAELPDEDEVVDAFVRGIHGLDEVTREMLAHYREAGDADPVDAHVAAGGSGKRGYAYARNRTLRKAGVIEHDGAGRYRYALPDLVAEAFDGNVADATVDDAVEAIEAATDLD